MMAATSLRRSAMPAVDRVVAGLTEMVVGDLTPGAQLPSEAELATAYAVSRLTVREAVKVLAGRGLLDLARGRRAVVLLPHWNSDALSYNSLCRLLNYMGIAVLRLSMPHHDIRRPAEIDRADYAVSANIGRTLDSVRQGVVDVRCCLDWLESQGYNRLGIVGTSLGSCYAFIATAHDPRIQVAAFNHASTYFADVVWHGQSTRHIREGLETAIDLENLRQVWRAGSPMVYFDKFSRWPRRSLIIYAKYDMTFLPEFSEQVVEQFEKHNLDHKVVVLPCGHYTLGETPYKYMDGWQLVSFLRTAFD